MVALTLAGGGGRVPNAKPRFVGAVQETDPGWGGQPLSQLSWGLLPRAERCSVRAEFFGWWRSVDDDPE